MSHISKKLITYNGVRVTADWPGKIDAAQSLTHYTVAGKKFPRIPFGDEDPRWGQKPCLNCAVLKGQFHVPDCEYEKCPACGQLLAGGCSCDIEELRESGEVPDPQSTLASAKRMRRFNAWCWAFIILALLLLGRSILMLFGI